MRLFRIKRSKRFGGKYDSRFFASFKAAIASINNKYANQGGSIEEVEIICITSTSNKEVKEYIKKHKEDRGYKMHYQHDLLRPNRAACALNRQWNLTTEKKNVTCKGCLEYIKKIFG